MKNAKRNGIITWVAVAVLLAVWAGSAVVAQRGPGGGVDGPGAPPPPPPITIIKAGAEGVFALTGCEVVKYDASLQEQEMLNLCEQLGTQESQNPGRGQRPRMPMPVAMLLTAGTDGAQEKLLVVIGDQFFCIDAASFEVTAKATLPAVQPPPPRSDRAGAGRHGRHVAGGSRLGPSDNDTRRPPMPFGPPPPPPRLALHGQTPYVLRANQIVALNIDDGTLAGQAELPKPPGAGDR